MRAALIFILHISSSFLHGADSPPRDWKAHPAIVEIDTTHDIYAVGDIHGDYERFISLLVAHKIITEDPPEPRKAVWNAGKAVLVCTGDVIDKGDQALRVIALFQALAAQAEKAGGRVVLCMGNHEADFLASKGKALKNAEFVKELQRDQLDAAEVSAGRDKRGVGEFLRSLPFSCRVNAWFFVHAGETRGKTLPQLREEFQKDVDAHGYKADALLGTEGALEARLHPRPWWEREGEKKMAGQQRLAKQVKALGVGHLVIGHQPQEVVFADGSSRKKGEMVQKFDGLIFLIDVGMSRGVGYSNGAMLHIHAGKKHGTATKLLPDRTTVVLWKSP